jgi:hypothetical protein
MTIKSWSYSKLLDFEACPLRFKLKHVDRVPEEKSPAADRGTAIHQLAEDYTNGKLKTLAPELRHFKDEFEILRREYKAKAVSLEGEWGFANNWEQHDYRTAWLRMKADAVMHKQLSHEAIVIDFKTGKKFGNEIKHGEQVQLYALATAIREPWIKNITVELWYLDLDDMTQNTYTRTQAMSFIPGFEKRANKIFTCKSFEPRANIFTCKCCAYGPSKGGQCTFGITGSETVASYRQRFG